MTTVSRFANSSSTKTEEKDSKDTRKANNRAVKLSYRERRRQEDRKYG